jgi:hypothetical protein
MFRVSSFHCRGRSAMAAVARWLKVARNSEWSVIYSLLSPLWRPGCLQCTTFHATRKSRKVTRTVGEVRKGEISPGGYETWNGETLRVPPLPPSHLVHCRIIDIQYAVVVSQSSPSIHGMRFRLYNAQWPFLTPNSSQAVTILTEIAVISSLYFHACNESRAN